ncbi:MAG: hypothetical protein GY859_29080 [Desulfobacterales bacterium]|nr:hypothetical protein [Desulfobacterales bacterium]
MSFKENLLKKIEIDAMARTVISTIGPLESGLKVDKETMRRLLEIGGFEYTRVRDLDLYILEGDANAGKLLVLDNDLPVYQTSAADVALRKSPYVKEMVSIRNIIKILKDTDVVILKKEESVRAVQRACVGMLDFSHEKSDLEEIEAEGAASLENGYSDGVIESLSLFAELLGWRPPPAPFRIRHHHIIGALTKQDDGETIYGPMALYSLAYDSLKLVEWRASSLNKEQTRRLQRIASGKEDPSAEGASVFNHLANLVGEYSPGPG